MHPILLKFGPITLYSYGLMVALGFLSAVGLALRQALRIGLDPDRLQKWCVLVFLGGLVGARAAYVLLYWELFRSNPVEIFRFDHGGLVFYGGLGAGLLAGFGGFRWLQLPVWVTIDLMTPPLVLAHAIGRIGCFLNGCCYGKPTELPWGVRFPSDELTRHPTQLYEMAALLVFFFLLKAVERRSVKPGTVILSYGLLYGVWRFSIEFLRGDNPPGPGGLTVFQWISLPLAAISGLLLLRLNLRKSP